MSAKSPITGDEIKSKSYSAAGRHNHDFIFKKQTFGEWFFEVHEKHAPTWTEKYSELINRSKFNEIMGEVHLE